MATHTIDRFVDANGDEFVFSGPDVSNKLDKNGDGSDVTVEFTEAANRTNIATGSKLSTLFGQIRKWFADLKALAFKDKVGTSDVESGTYPIDISGNAATAATLATPRKIDGVEFDGSGDVIHYGECNTAATVQAKVIVCPGFVLTTGARIIIKFTKNNNFRDPTFNVNNTGAVPVRYFGSQLPTANFLRSGAVYQFIYDGTNYCFVGNFDNNNHVYQSASSTNAEYPIACKNSANQTAENNYVHYASGITMNPSTNKITASGGFVGNLSGNAATADSATTASSATVLANPRNIHVNLESNTGANFNGSANITPGVSGVLPTISGGTGFSTVDTAPTENSNKMVVSGGVWSFSAPAKLGILTGSSVNVNNNFDDFDRFAVLVTSAVRLRTYWLNKKSGHVIEFYNLNDYEIAVNVVIEIGQTVVFHRQAASTITWTNSGSTTSAQTLCSLSYKGYCKFYVTYDSAAGQFDIYQNSNFAYVTGNVTTSMIGNVGTSGTTDTKTGVVYHNDIVCNHASGNYAINVERLVIGQVYRFQFLTKTGYTYLYNNGTSNVTVYTGNTSFTLGPGWNANIQASSSAVASHTVSVVRMSATLVYIIWGY